MNVAIMQPAVGQTISKKISDADPMVKIGGLETVKMGFLLCS